MLDPKDIIALASLLFAVASFIYSRHTASRSAQQEDITSHSKHIAKLDAAVLALETRVSALPTKDGFHQLELAVSKMEGSVRVLETELKPIAQSISRIEKYLLEATPKRPAR